MAVLLDRPGRAVHVRSVALRRAVVRREDDECALDQSPPLERRKDLPDRPIDLVHEIAAPARAALADEVRRRGDGGVRRRERHVEEERYSGMARPLLDVRHRALGQSGHHERKVPAWERGAGMAEHAVRLCRRRIADRPVVLDKAVGGEVGNIVAEVAVEPVRDRAASNGASKIDALSVGAAYLRRQAEAAELV